MAVLIEEINQEEKNRLKQLQQSQSELSTAVFTSSFFHSECTRILNRLSSPSQQQLSIDASLLASNREIEHQLNQLKEFVSALEHGQHVIKVADMSTVQPVLYVSAIQSVISRMGNVSRVKISDSISSQPSNRYEYCLLFVCV